MEWRAWWKMLLRCYDDEHESYPNYGERGIRVAKAWRGSNGFTKFLTHVGPRPSAKHSIDRIDSAGDYKPGNVQWATRTEQNQNTRRNVMVTFKGKTHCIAEWSRITGINAETLRERIKHGWSTRDALHVAPSKRNRKGH